MSRLRILSNGLLLAALVLGFIIVVTSWRGAYRLRKRNTVCDRIGGS